MTPYGISVAEDLLEPIHPLPCLLPAHALPPSVRTGVLAERAAPASVKPVAGNPHTAPRLAALPPSVRTGVLAERAALRASSL